MNNLNNLIEEDIVLYMNTKIVICNMILMKSKIICLVPTLKELLMEKILIKNYMSFHFLLLIKMNISP